VARCVKPRPVGSCFREDIISFAPGLVQGYKVGRVSGWLYIEGREQGTILVSIVDLGG
jgi:hypothetical protein